jgi:CHASE2 domain-containing sensor protein
VKLKSVTEHKFFRPAMGAALAVLCGLALWQMPLGERWVNLSYDYLFRFGTRSTSNKVVLILMDNEAYKSDQLRQLRGQPWDRALHAKLLNRLADDGCPLVVMDVFLEQGRDPAKDEELANALARQRCAVLGAEHAGITHPGVVSAGPTPPVEPFDSAARTNWGVAWLHPDLDSIVRKHWPFPAPIESYNSLPWTAAQLAGAQLSKVPQEQWLRYYGERGAWEPLSYHLALMKGQNYFHDKIVFVGSDPETSVPGDEGLDEFSTPYTRWTGESAGGVKILATEFLNLMNGDWLRRPAEWVEVLALLATGVLLGGGLSRARPSVACGLAAGAGLAVTLGAVWWSHMSNYWFPWMVIVGGQVPSALAWSLITGRIPRVTGVRSKVSQPDGTTVEGTNRPDTPDYELFDPPIGVGGFGNVWLARNAIGQWQALKAVYASKFAKVGPYEAEFKGIERYKPISDKHPGLLRIDFVSRMKPEGYFYYVMELGDAQVSGWQKDPITYKPWNLASMRAQSPNGRLPVEDCIHIGLALSEALDFLHGKGLTHRDIKPSNVIFVNGQPKLADVGLVTDIRPPAQIHTYVGTPGYMPPAPEPPGTVEADLYALGMLLYVTSTGRDPDFFPQLSTTLVGRTGRADFIHLNSVILKACQPDPARRYTSAAEMRAALQKVHKAIECADTERP